MRVRRMRMKTAKIRSRGDRKMKYVTKCYTGSRNETEEKYVFIYETEKT